MGTGGAYYVDCVDLLLLETKKNDIGGLPAQKVAQWYKQDLRKTCRKKKKHLG